MAAKLENKVNSSESYTNPKPKTAINGRSKYEDILGTETLTNNYHFSFGAPSSAMMAKLRPLLTEATKQCMVRFKLSLYYLLCSHHCTVLKVV